MTFRAIHKNTNQEVSIWKLNNDPAWVGRQKTEEWVARKIDIQNYDEIQGEVPLVHINKSTDGRCEHFRINHPNAISFSQNESPKHREIKERIYDTLVENKIIFFCQNQEYKPKELPIKDIFVEYHDDYTGKYSDIQIVFSEEHPQLGNGIVIEVQLSHQNCNKTLQRSWEKILGGSSICWIMNQEYEDYIRGKKRLKVVSYIEAIEDYKEQKLSEEQERVNNIGESLNRKISELKKVEKELDERIKRKEEILNRKIKEIENKVEDTKETISKKISSKIYNEDVPLLRNELKNEYQKEIKENIDLKDIEEETRKKINIEFHNILNENRQKIEKISESMGNKIDYEIKNKFDKEIDQLKKNYKKKFQDKIENDEIFEKLHKEMREIYEEYKTKNINSFLKLRNDVQEYERKVRGYFKKTWEIAGFWKKELEKRLNESKDKTEHELLKEKIQRVEKVSKQTKEYVQKEQGVEVNKDKKEENVQQNLCA